MPTSSEHFSINDTNKLMGWIVLGNAVVWVTVYLCIWKGVRSSVRRCRLLIHSSNESAAQSWVVYITVPTPFILMAVLLVRTVQLPGASEGIRWYLTPDFAALWHRPSIWTDAVQQIFFR